MLMAIAPRLGGSEYLCARIEDRLPAIRIPRAVPGRALVLEEAVIPALGVRLPPRFAHHHSPHARDRFAITVFFARFLHPFAILGELSSRDFGAGGGAALAGGHGNPQRRKKQRAGTPTRADQNQDRVPLVD